MHELKGMIYPVEALGCGPMAPAHPRLGGGRPGHPPRGGDAEGRRRGDAAGEQAAAPNSSRVFRAGGDDREQGSKLPVGTRGFGYLRPV